MSGARHLTGELLALLGTEVNSDTNDILMEELSRSGQSYTTSERTDF